MFKISKKQDNVLKFSYRGSLVFISYRPDFSYQDIVASVIERFRIPQDNSTILQITNENGYILDKQLFENFILLFPSPEIIFYVRRCCKLNASTRIQFNNEKQYKNNYRNTNSESNSRNRFKCRTGNAEQAEKDNSYGAPVKRQNCFIGSLPEELCSVPDCSQISKRNVRRRPLDGLQQQRSGLRAKNSRNSPIRMRYRLLRI